ncbi:20462_t:CDS:2, partial [Cetraspora pellucida]
AYLNESSAISALLDPCNKLSIYNFTEHEQIINKLHEVYQIYKAPKENKPLPLITYEIEKYFSEPKTETNLLLW